MSKSKRDPKRKKNLEMYKKKKQVQKQIQQKVNQIMTERNTQQPQGQPALPEIRQSPVWNSGDMLEISGAEWETIFNFIETAANAYYAANAVMSRNIITGKVRLQFDKLNKEAGIYERMTAEEEAPYQAEVQNAIQNAIKMQNSQNEQRQTAVASDISEEPVPTPPSQEGLPYIDKLVDANGNPLTSE